MAHKAENTKGNVTVAPAQTVLSQSAANELTTSQDVEDTAPHDEEGKVVQTDGNTTKAKRRLPKKKKKKTAHEDTTVTSSARLAQILAATSYERSENVVEQSQAPSVSPKAGLSPESSASPSAFASQGVGEEPTETPVPSTHERISALISELQRLSYADDDAPALRAGISALVEPFQHLVQVYDHEARVSEDTITVLKKKEQEASARSLVVTSFDDTLDRVSEGQVKSEVVYLNHAIGDFALDIMQGIFEVTPDQSQVDKARKSSRSSLVTTSSYLLLGDDEKRGYLIEALVHKTVVERLHHLFFQGQVAITNRSEATERMFETMVMKEESWKIAQRWRSITSNVFDRQLEPAVINRDITQAAKLISEDISMASGRPLDALPDLKVDILRALPAIYAEARKVATSARRDHVSSQLKIVMTPSKQEMPTIDTTRVDIQWEGIVAPADDDRVLGTYAFGLHKVVEGESPIVLLRPKIITGSLERLDPDHTRREAKKAEAKEAKAARKAAKGGNKEGSKETEAKEAMKRVQEPEGETVEVDSAAKKAEDSVTKRSNSADEAGDAEGQSGPPKKKKKKGGKKNKGPKASQMDEDRGFMPDLRLDDPDTDQVVRPSEEKPLNELV